MEGGLRMKLRENNIDIFTAVRTSDLWLLFSVNPVPLIYKMSVTFPEM
jgi:hypothetical protein